MLTLFHCHREYTFIPHPITSPLAYCCAGFLTTNIGCCPIISFLESHSTPACAHPASPLRARFILHAPFRNKRALSYAFSLAKRQRFSHTARSFWHILYHYFIALLRPFSTASATQCALSFFYCSFEKHTYLRSLFCCLPFIAVSSSLIADSLRPNSAVSPVTCFAARANNGVIAVAACVPKFWPDTTETISSAHRLQADAIGTSDQRIADGRAP